MTGSQRTGAQWVVEALRAQGVETVFGYPGGAIMPVYDALYDGGVEHLLCRHEQGAAMAAIGYARASGRVGVCIATSGPGATNLITGLADALLDSVPMVAITGQVASPLIGTDAFQEVDVLGLSLACTKHSFLVRRPEELTSVLAEAFRVASSGRPGPVLVDIPKDIQLMTIRPQPLAVADAPQPSCPSSALAQAQQLLQAAQRPMLYVGGGVALAGAVAQLNALLLHSAMPSVATLKGLGAVDPHHPYYLGMLGMHGSKAANLAVQQCDLLLVVGARFDDRVTGKLDTFAPDAKVIHLDIDSAEFGKLRRPDVALHGDLRALLPALSAALTAPLSIAPWLAQIDALNAEHAWDYAAAEHGERIDAPALLRTLSQRRPRTSVVTTDVGQHQMWVAQHMQFTSPHDLLTSAGLGTMGFGLPAAVGAQMARPQDCVICVSGDGSFMMNVQELGTLKRRRLPVKIVLLDNQRLGMVRQWQSLFFAGRFSETDLSDNPDFLTLASAFGIPGQQIWHQDQVADALETMLASPGPYLLHVRINEQDNVWPLVPPGAGNDTMLEAL
ncbi:acetolactate synthase 2 catalytic subunit [Plesiomonas shigelloides]|uniref:acetolactate synthase 2 catalytic subunit n=1 Tax=Plesiomonas shigelloides TaxID=703 RepID=UPI001782550D|nr:acetolactate synthase 2 catalytic subunit [Plesiomonas shigelloides]QOH79846.1 acetolactate synthase 2 catalytic subunit [Plesiomonas shigelloides]